MFNWFWEFLYRILEAILYLIDFIVDCFRLLAGITDVSITDSTTGTTQSTDILSYFLSSYTITRAFMMIAALCISLVVLLTIIAIIRKQYLEDREQRSIGAIVGSALKSFLTFLLVPMIMLAANTLLVSFVRVLDTVTNPFLETLVERGETSYSGTGYTDAGLSIGGTLLYIVGYKCMKKDASGFMTGKLGYSDLSTVEEYFTLSSMNWFIGYLSGIVILVMFIKSLFSFVERIFSILGLYITAPIAASSTVLDGGVRFKNWRDSIVNKFIIAYSILLGVNLYFIVLPIVLQIKFFDDSYKNYLVQLFFIIGGAFAVNKFLTLFGNIVNSGAGNQAQMESDSAGRGLMGAARTVAGGAARLAGGAISGGWGAFKNATGFVTPVERFKARGEELRKAKLDARSGKAGRDWKENFYKNNPDYVPRNERGRYPELFEKKDEKND